MREMGHGWKEWLEGENEFKSVCFSLSQSVPLSDISRTRPKQLLKAGFSLSSRLTSCRNKKGHEWENECQKRKWGESELNKGMSWRREVVRVWKEKVSFRASVRQVKDETLHTRWWRWWWRKRRKEGSTIRTRRSEGERRRERLLFQVSQKG